MKKILATSIVLATLSAAVQNAVADTENNAGTTTAMQKVAGQTEQKTAHNTMKKPWLGVVLAPVPEVLSKQLASIIPEKQGVMVQSVVPDSPAANSGLQAYDILLSFNHDSNEQQLFSAQQLAGLIASSKPEDEVTLSVVRNGRKQDVKVTLGGKEFALRQSGMARPKFGGFNHGFFNQQGQSNFWSQPFARPNFAQPPFPYGGFPKAPDMPAAPNAQGRVNVMQQFESISINKTGDGKVRAVVSYDNNGDKKEFTFEGKYDEVRKQITETKELPEDKKNSLLNALKNNPNQLLPDGFMNFPQMPAFPTMPSFNGFFNQRQQAPSWFNNSSKL